MQKSFNIATENNPNWQIAEPILLDIWADGIPKSKYRLLHLANLMSWSFAAPLFLGGVVLRSSLVVSFLFICYVIFPNILTTSFDLIFSGKQMDSDFWAYQLLGYVIIIKSTLFIFGDGLKDFITQSIICLLLFLTNMLPLKYFAKGLRKENYIACALVRNELIGMLMVQFKAAFPSDIDREYDQVFDLYLDSNNLASREELERLAEEHAKKKN